ncbi:hypothetical protein GCM10022423_42260 [Flavobacterium ginsengiterrae]|uniref:Uncharacterized protein n=2 Tax=Flavobacterium ginsengiterrae TaxID=871695 RepID=A0ABP7H8K0_9FLAO
MTLAFKKYLMKDLNTLFQDLTELARTTDNNSSLPKLELLLKNGRSVTGITIKSQEEKSFLPSYTNHHS